jgi:two-component system, OmpR family, sensor histidine kinase PrrB
MIHNSLRGRVALAAGAATAVVILLGGFVVTELVMNSERHSLDQRLDEQSDSVEGPILDALASGSPLAVLDLSTRRPDVGTVIRVWDGSHLYTVGSTDVTFPKPSVTDGFATLHAGDRTWRVQTRHFEVRTNATDDPRSVVLQTAVPTTATDELISNLRFRTIEVALLSAVLAGIAGWTMGEVAMRPLGRLQQAAETVSRSRDLTVRIPRADRGPQEVADLAQSLNVMLERLQEAAESTEAALASSRAFAGNAAHEMRTPLTSMQANIDVLRKNPNLPREQFDDIVESVSQEQTRLIGLLDALHTLARGDVVGEAQRYDTDLSDLVGVAVDAARRRFPHVHFDYELPSEGTELSGWPDGLRVMIDNLLTNAARHGDNQVLVSVWTDDDIVSVRVEDNGPGIPADERDAVFERFYRGRNVKSSGTGLGLALVAQQARIHGGDVEVDESEFGGARFTVTLRPASE